MRRLIAMRKRSRVFGRGSLEFLLPNNPKVLAYIRQYEDETVMIVANLSKYPQYAELDLSRFEGLVPVEAFGKSRFPPIGTLPYLLTLSEHAFHLFSLKPQQEGVLSIVERSLPTERVTGNWEELFTTPARHRLEAALPTFLKRRPWFLGAGANIRGVAVESSHPLDFADGTRFGYLAILLVDYVDREAERYALPLGWMSGEAIHDWIHRHGESVVLRLLTDREEPGIIFDLQGSEAWTDWWLRQVSGAGAQPFPNAELQSVGCSPPSLEPYASLHPAYVEQGRPSHAWLRLNDRGMLRLFQFVDGQTSPHVEMRGFLRKHAPEGLLPEWIGAWDLKPRGAKSQITLAELSAFVPNEGTAWSQMLGHLQQFHEEITTERSSLPAPPRDTAPEPARQSLWTLVDQAATETCLQLMGSHLPWLERIGERTAEFHRVVASAPDDPAFAPIPCTPFYPRGLYQALRNTARRALERLQSTVRQLDPESQTAGEALLACQSQIMQALEPLLAREFTFSRVRCHGSYGLKHLVFTGRDYLLFDFQGNLDETVGERRLKRPLASDVAGMIWSLERAAQTARVLTEERGEASPHLHGWTNFWFRHASATFLRSYLGMIEGKDLSASREELSTLLNCFLLQTSLSAVRRQLAAPSEELPAILWSATRTIGLF
jgi:maltose alpha-D-glucosyltransferase/alpha-amylase